MEPRADFQGGMVDEVTLPLAVTAVKGYPVLAKHNADVEHLEHLARSIAVEQGYQERSLSASHLKSKLNRIKWHLLSCCGVCTDDLEASGELDYDEEELEELERSSLLKQPVTNYHGKPREPKVEEFVKEFEKEVHMVSKTVRHELRKIETRLEDAKERCQESKLSVTARREAFGPEFTEVYRLGHYLSTYAVRNYSTLMALLTVNDVAEARWQARNDRLLGPLLREEVLEAADFGQALNIQHFLKRVVQVCADELYNGDIKLASFVMLEKRRQSLDWSLIFIGARCGFALGMLCWALYAVVFDSDMQTEAFENSNGLRIYRSIGAILLFYWGAAIQLAAWRESRINFPVIFAIPSQAFPATREMFRWGALVSTIYFVNVIIFVKELRIPKNEERAGLFPLLLLFGFVLIAFGWWAKNVFVPHARWKGFRGALWFTFSTACIFVFGLSETDFLTAFVADYLTSSTKILVDFTFVTCSLIDAGPASFAQNLARGTTHCQQNFVMNRVVVPIITCWPLWLRLGQNLNRLYTTGKEWPFLANAMKYGFSHTIVIFSAMKPGLLDLSNGSSPVPWIYRAIFVALFALTSLITFAWDVGMDWGFGRPQHKLLRKRLMLSSLWGGSRLPYYVFILIDFFMRYLWTVTLLPGSTVGTTWVFSTTSLIMAEVMRRTMWGLLRLENEHLSNTRGYRTAAYIPLYFSTWQEPDENSTQTKEMQDEDDEAAFSAAAPTTQPASSSVFDEWLSSVIEVVVFVFILAALAAVAVFA